jgi:hypothetical protein
MKKLDLGSVAEPTKFAKVVAGGYVCGILAVEDFPEKEYLKITYDIIEGELKGHYSNLKKEKGWALPAFIASYKDTALSFFKGTITSFEKSNKGFTWKDNEQDLVKKKVGLVLYEEEYVKQNGTVGVRMKVDKAHSVEAIKSGDFEVPERKCLAQTASNVSDPFAKPSTAVADDFFGGTEATTTPNETPEEMPFDDFPF